MLTLQIPLNSHGKRFEFDLEQNRVTIGRRHDNDVRIKETYVSAYHAEFTRSQDRLILKDRNSANGTFLNGRRVNGAVEVRVGDRLKFGSLPCYLVESESDQEEMIAVGSRESEINELKALLARTQGELELSRAEVLQLRSGNKNKRKADVFEIKSSELHEMLNLTDVLTEERSRSLRKIDSLSGELKRLKEGKGKGVQTGDQELKQRLSKLEVANEELRMENVHLREELCGLRGLRKDKASSTSLVQRIQADQIGLKKQAPQLRSKKAELSKGALTEVKETGGCEQTYQGISQDCEEASHRLDKLSQQLQDSEKKVNALRCLELELEKAVQRGKLSRKGIYNENFSENSELLPEVEQRMCREVIDRLDLLEDLLKQYQQKWFSPKVAHQLKLLRDSFMTLLRHHSVDNFEFKPGTEVSFDARRKIQLISVDDFGDARLKKKSERLDGNKTTILETVRPGFVYSKNGRDVIIRKAEVIVA